MLYRPGSVFEDLRACPSWLPPAIGAALAGTLYSSVAFVSNMLRLVRDAPDPERQLVESFGDLGSFLLWVPALALLAAAENTVSVLALAGGTAVLARPHRLGAEFRHIRSVVSYSLVWLVLARHLLSWIGIGVQWGVDLESVPRAFAVPRAARLLDELPADS